MAISGTKIRMTAYEERALRLTAAGAWIFVVKGCDDLGLVAGVVVVDVVDELHQNPQFSNPRSTVDTH